MQPTGPSAAPGMPFSELGELSGVPHQAQQAPASLPSVPQLKAKSALGAFAAQRVAGLAPQALDLVSNALAAGRRGQCDLTQHVIVAPVFCLVTLGIGMLLLCPALPSIICCKCFYSYRSCISSWFILLVAILIQHFVLIASC